ncbi:MAG TPA: Uma2 family endonuclease [Thermoanaerobaculia bacterium]
MAVAISDARRLTREEYERLVEEDFFAPDARIELIHGRLVEMAPQTTFHAVGVNRVQVALGRVFRESFAVRVQLPLAIDPDSEPEPDVAVVPGEPEDYSFSHPTSAVLVVEVSESSMKIDREKAEIYARAGIPEYWILDLRRRQLEVHRNPENGTYASKTVLREPGFVSPLGRNERIAIADLLPLPGR